MLEGDGGVRERQLGPKDLFPHRFLNVLFLRDSFQQVSMQLLPNLEDAVIPVENLRDYALNMEHPDGRHKAIVFKEVLAIERRHADVLAELLRSTLPSAPARQGKGDEYGDHWTTYHAIIGLNAQPGIVTVGWILKKEQSQAPQLVSCYIETKRQQKLRERLGLTQGKA
jgi:uncharacterized protein DUF6883